MSAFLLTLSYYSFQGPNGHQGGGGDHGAVPHPPGGDPGEAEEDQVGGFQYPSGGGNYKERKIPGYRV
jgi:hypothetical protein